MPNPLYVLPDLDLALLAYYRARTEIMAILPGTSSIATQLPSGFVSPAPFVVLNVLGGGGIWPALGDDAVGIDCYGSDKITAGKLARTVRAATWAISNDIIGGATLCSADEEVGPQWFPDAAPTIPLPRYVARYRVVYHP